MTPPDSLSALVAAELAFPPDPNPAMRAARHLGEDIVARHGDAVAAVLGRSLVGALGLDGAKRERDRLGEAAVAALAGFGPEADVLRAAARFAAQRKS